MMRKMMLVAAVALLAGVFGASAEDKRAQPFDDTVFVKTAAISGMSEVHLGELAATTTKNEDVKNLAEMTVKDHTAANAELKAAAKDAGIEVPTKIDDAHQKQYEGFKAYKGDNFDRDYVKTLVQSHTQSVALYTQASKEAKNPALKDFATKTLPTLKKHLDMAKKLDK